jgi:hypothetical protein
MLLLMGWNAFEKENTARNAQRVCAEVCEGSYEFVVEHAITRCTCQDMGCDPD